MILRFDAEETALDTMLCDEALMDLIEQAFLAGQIDGETLSLAFLWIEGNDSCMH